MNGCYRSKEEVLARAQGAVGKTFGELDVAGRLSRGGNKGGLGQVVEEGWFGLKPNSRAEYDFPEAKVELKVTPFIREKKGEIRAKERLVCNIIDYMEEAEKSDFFDSLFWKKCATMLIMPYEYRYGLPRDCFRIAAAFLHAFSNEDLAIIEQDWAWIVGKIRAGKAHELSEAETDYLAACPKGSSKRTVRPQPYSSELAMQRAYALKASYMTRVIRVALGKKPSPSLIRDRSALKGRFEDYVLETISPYLGWTQRALAEHLGVAMTGKDIRARLIAAIYGVKGRLSGTEEFQKANIYARTLHFERAKKKTTSCDASAFRLKESLPLPAFRIAELLAEPTWEESEFQTLLRTQKFFFIVFKDGKDGEARLEQVFFWHMPEKDIAEAQKVWERTRELIRKGVVLTQRKGGRQGNNLPKLTENPVAHVRPHCQNATETDKLPDGRTITKQGFWLNNNYLMHVVEGER